MCQQALLLIHYFYNEQEDSFIACVKYRRTWSAYIIKDKPGCHISNFVPSEYWHVRATEHTKYKPTPSIMQKELVFLAMILTDTNYQWNQYHMVQWWMWLLVSLSVFVFLWSKWNDSVRDCDHNCSYLCNFQQFYYQQEEQCNYNLRPCPKQQRQILLGTHIHLPWLCSMGLFVLTVCRLTKTNSTCFSVWTNKSTTYIKSE